ncbi:MAG: hypothetical protein H6651_19050 [Ardenticatenales bacterium]|nr:hypothetical protein [Ardenticatenales bacterium]
MSMIICPNCEKENPADRYYCDFCGFRLVAPDMPAEEPEEDEERPDSSGPNPFSLPSRQPGETGDLDLDNIPDWLRTGEHKIPEESKSSSSDSDWLSDLEDITFNVGQADEVEDWLDMSGPDLAEAPAELVNAVPDIDEPLPDLDEPLPEQNLSGADELLQWQDGAELDSDELPDWLATDESGELTASPDDASAEPTLTNWLNEDVLDDSPATEQGSRVVSDLGGLTSFLAELDEAAPASPDELVDDSPLSLLDPMPADAEIEAFRLGTSELGETSPVEDEPSASDDFLSDLGDLDFAGEEPALADAELEAFNFLDADMAAAGLDEDVFADDETESEAEAPGAGADFTFDLEQDLPEAFAVDSSAEADSPEQANEDLDLAGFTSWLTELQETVQDPALSQDINQADLVTDPNLDIPADAEEEALPEEFLEELARDEAEDVVIDGNSNLPDWLTEIRPDDTGILPSLEDDGDERIAPVADAIPDWLADISPDSLPEADDGFALSDDWLADVVPGASDETLLPPAESGSGVPIADLEADVAADWLDELVGASGEEEPAGDTFEDYRDTIVVPPPSRPDTGQLEGVPEELAGADLPDWLSGATIDESAAPMPAARTSSLDEEFLSQDDISYDEMPDWLQPEQADFDTALESALAVQGSEMISAMGGEWAAMLAELPGAAEDEPEEPIQLEAAEIPEWLQELKPDENAPHEAAEPEEVTGVLAGVRGVIDVEPVIALPRQAEQLQQVAVTDQEQQQAALLRQVAIAERAQVIHLGAQRARAIPAWARLLLAVLLIAALLASQLAPVKTLVDNLLTPPPAPAESSAALDLLAGINNQTVLVAVDYTPAMQGELDALARPLLAQLAAQGNQFVLMSQYPAGMALARQLTAELDTAELGYLPGEAVALRQLSSCLNDAACEGLEAAAGDIGLILLLTSERTSLQNWMEQVTALNDTIPLVAALPELLSPLAAPYLQTGQIDGALSGAQSGAAATDDAALVDLARSQTVAIWLVIILLLLGNVIALFGGRRRAATAPLAPRQPEEEAVTEEDELP